MTNVGELVADGSCHAAVRGADGEGDELEGPPTAVLLPAGEAATILLALPAPGGLPERPVLVDCLPTVVE